MLKISENNGTEKIGLVTPTTALYITSQKSHTCCLPFVDLLGFTTPHESKSYEFNIYCYSTHAKQSTTKADAHIIGENVLCTSVSMTHNHSYKNHGTASDRGAEMDATSIVIPGWIP